MGSVASRKSYEIAQEAFQAALDKTWEPPQVIGEASGSGVIDTFMETFIEKLSTAVDDELKARFDQ